MPSSPFDENLCPSKNMDIEYLCYLMLMNMSMLRSECVKESFDVESSITRCCYPLLHKVCETNSHCFALSLKLYLHLVIDPPSCCKHFNTWKTEKGDYTPFWKNTLLNASCHCNLLLCSLVHFSLVKFH